MACPSSPRTQRSTIAVCTLCALNRVHTFSVGVFEYNVSTSSYIADLHAAHMMPSLHSFYFMFHCPCLPLSLSPCQPSAQQQTVPYPLRCKLYYNRYDALSQNFFFPFPLFAFAFAFIVWPLREWENKYYFSCWQRWSRAHVVRSISMWSQEFRFEKCWDFLLLLPYIEFPSSAHIVHIHIVPHARFTGLQSNEPMKNYYTLMSANWVKLDWHTVYFVYGWLGTGMNGIQ